MANTLTTAEIKERLKQLDILEKQEREKLETLRNQKTTEITENIENDQVQLTPQEEKIVKKKFKGKTVKETKIIIQTNKDPKLKRILIKIGMIVGIPIIAGALIIYVWHWAQKDAKSKRIYETEQGVDSTKNDNNQAKVEEGSTPPPEDVFSVEQLEQNIPQAALHNITYQDLFDVVQGVTNTEIQKQVITFLKAGDITGLQTFYGMKTNSEYTSNKATGKLDHNTLNKIKNPLFGLVGQEVINNPNIPGDVKEKYQEFINGTIPNGNIAYLILSKKTCTQYLFSKDHKLINNQTILIGADLGKRGRFMPYNYYKLENGQKKYTKGEINRNTPTELFKVKKIRDNLQSGYKVDGPKRGIGIVPIDNQGNIDKRFECDRRGLAIHPTYEPPSNPEKYADAMNSSSIVDNSITHGCPNVQNFGIIFDQLELGSKVYICTE